MSFSYFVTSRSKGEALRDLEARKGSLPASVFDLIGTSIKNIGPISGHELRAIVVKACGHVSESPSDLNVSKADVTVEPIFAPE